MSTTDTTTEAFADSPPSSQSAVATAFIAGSPLSSVR